jgi:hypothetical protein
MVVSSTADDQDEEAFELFRQRRMRKRVRRQILAAAHHRRCVAAIAAAMDGSQGPSGKKHRPLQQFSWEEHVLRFTEDEFKLRYRLDFDSFMELVNILRADLSVTDEKQARYAKWGQVVRPEVKLAMALRFLAGGSPLDLKLIYYVSYSYVYDCVWLVVDAVNKHLPMEFPIDDVDKLRKLEAEWRSRAKCPDWVGQVSSLDGVHFPIRAPSASDVKDPTRYHVGRKDKYAVLAMALCDADRRFLWFNMSQTPNTHDSLAWTLTDLGMRIKAGDLPTDFFINADAAFTVSNSLITPIGDGGTFDYHQSSNRIAIECAFGELVRRWPILWKPLQVKFSRCSCLISACASLHNFCIDKRVQDATTSVNGLAQIQPSRWELYPLFNKDGGPVDYLDTEHSDGQRASRAQEDSSDLKRLHALIAAVEECGVERPPLPDTVVLKRKRKRKRAA